jgi:hypothetical protein
MKTLKFTIVGLLLSGFAIGQSTNAKKELLHVPGEEPVFKSGEFGVRYMPSYSMIKFRTSNGDLKRGEFVVGHGVGAFIGINSKYVGLQLEVIYNSLAQKYKDNTFERTVHMNYINIPLLITLNTNRAKAVNFQLAVGPQLGISIGSKLETSGSGSSGNMSVYRAGTAGTDTLQAVLAVKKSDFGIAYGAGLDFALIPARTLRLGIGFRGVAGLVDISDKSATTVTKQYYILDRTMTQTYSGYIGLSFMF